jgi:hypothetical protein
MLLRCGLFLAGLVIACAPVALAQDAEEAESPVARAVVCTDVVEREPVGEAASFDAEVGRLFCFTEIRGMEGTTITHAWIHEGKTRARVDLPVRSNRWRTWSTKTIAPGWTGQWQVKVLDADGIVLSSQEFVVE